MMTPHRVSKPNQSESPDRRLAPRPLPLHLASAMLLWLSSRAALPNLKNALLPSRAEGERLRALAREIAAAGSDNVAAALDREIARRTEAYLTGLEAYRRHPYRRANTMQRVLWSESTTRLLDYASGSAGPVVLVVPSLINRSYVLDLLPELSFLRHLAERGLRPLVIDWGAPGSAECDFDLTDYITRRLEAAFTVASGISRAPIGVVGYCMGGLLALALALRRQREIACLALLATPWDFHAGRVAPARLLGSIADHLPLFCGGSGSVPVEVIQTLFLLLDPFGAERKFTRFASLDRESYEARCFVALEDWVNDGVPLALGVATAVARSWYWENGPARGLWKVAGEEVDPKRLSCPTLVVVPSRDRIVPPSSAEPLAAKLTSAVTLRAPLGHVGMMSAARAPRMLWAPIADWLCERLGDR
jgi:polyhydroxyalkanoate synthase subunit PhaC